jgi:hypothetical protein
MTAFNLLDLDTAIRLALVSATTGLVRGVYKMMAPENTKIEVGSLPYVLFLVEDFDLSPETFDGVSMSVTYQVQMVDHRDNGDGPVAAVWDAIVGNAVPPAQATSGLHIRQLTLSGDNTVATLELLGGGHMFTDDPDGHGVFLRFRAIYTKG